MNDIKNIISTVTGMNIFALSCFYFSSELKITIREATTLENNSSSILKALVFFLYKRANRIICTSAYIQDELIKHVKINRDHVVSLPNPIDIKKIKKSLNPKTTNLVEQSDGVKKIVAVGRLVKAKGFDVLIEALAIVKKTTRIKLVLVGEGPERASLESSIKRLKLVDDVFLVGYQSNPYLFIANSDLYVLSSRWEGYVNTVIEAMVLEVNIVATDCKSGPGELLKQQLGYPLVPIESPQKLAEAIIEELFNPRDTTEFAKLVQIHDMPLTIEKYLGESFAS